MWKEGTILLHRNGGSRGHQGTGMAAGRPWETAHRATCTSRSDTGLLKPHLSFSALSYPCSEGQRPLSVLPSGAVPEQLACAHVGCWLQARKGRVSPRFCSCRRVSVPLALSQPLREEVGQGILPVGKLNLDSYAL